MSAIPCTLVVSASCVESDAADAAIASDLAVATVVAVARTDVSAIPCTLVVSASCVAIAAEIAAVADISRQLPFVLAGEEASTYVVPLSD